MLPTDTHACSYQDSWWKYKLQTATHRHANSHNLIPGLPRACAWAVVWLAKNCHMGDSSRRLNPVQGKKSVLPRTIIVTIYLLMGTVERWSQGHHRYPSTGLVLHLVHPPSSIPRLISWWVNYELYFKIATLRHHNLGHLLAFYSWQNQAGNTSEEILEASASTHSLWNARMESIAEGRKMKRSRFVHYKKGECQWRLNVICKYIIANEGNLLTWFRMRWMLSSIPQFGVGQSSHYSTSLFSCPAL